MDASQLCMLAPWCPPPDRIVHSAWMSHIPFAFWLVDILRPALLVELGAYRGASFCAFCQQIERLGLACEAYAIDTWQGDPNMGAYDEEVYNDLASYLQSRYFGFASLVRSDFDGALDNFEDKSIDLLHIDGFHSGEAMLHDFGNWTPKVSDRGVALMHDVKARLPGYGGVAAWKEISRQYPSFAFPHGFGLGVVLVGANAPEALKKIASSGPEEIAAFCDKFREQGKIYEKLFTLEEKRLAEAERAKAELTESRRTSAELERILAEERNAADREREEWREAILKAKLEAQAFENSLSWKLTSPLRKLSRYFRS